MDGQCFKSFLKGSKTRPETRQFNDFIKSYNDDNDEGYFNIR